VYAHTISLGSRDVASDAPVIDDLRAARRYRRHQRLLSDMTLKGDVRGGMLAEEERIRRWLAVLRAGSEAERLGARRGLATVFERRGMLAEAIEALERNVEAGERRAETLRWLSRLYQAQGDEVRSLEAAVRACQDFEGAPPRAAVVRAPRLRLRSFIRGVPYVLMLSGLGIALGLVLWLLTPLLPR
jgi:hypothetical protein